MSGASDPEEEDEDDTGGDGDPDHPPPAERGDHNHPQYDDQHGAHHPEDLTHRDREHAGRSQLMTSDKDSGEFEDTCELYH